MIHILFLSPHCDPQANLGEPDSGGQCIYEHQLAIALSGLPDFRVTTFCRQTFQRPTESIINNSYTIRRIECGQPDFIPKEEIEAVLPAFVQQVAEFLETAPAEDTYILHGHYWDGGLACLQLKSLMASKLPFIWTPHSLGSSKRVRFPGLEHELEFNFIPRQCWESYSMMVADGIILSTEEERQVVLQQYAIDEAKIHTIAPGIDIHQFIRRPQSTVRKKYGLPIKGKILLCLGRMVKTKGYHQAIKVLAELKKSYSQPNSLVIVGGNPNSIQEQKYRQELINLTNQLQLQKDVFFLPAVQHEKVQEIFSLADIFLMSSAYEPFGIVTIEAMAMKLPVVASNSGGSLNLIQHNQTGILVDFKNSDQVTKYIRSLLMDVDQYKRIGDSAHRYVKNNFDWYHKSAQFAQVYRQTSRFQSQEPFHNWIQHKYFLQKYFTLPN